jgi:hypothetical protein
MLQPDTDANTMDGMWNIHEGGRKKEKTNSRVEMYGVTSHEISSVP